MFPSNRRELLKKSVLIIIFLGAIGSTLYFDIDIVLNEKYDSYIGNFFMNLRNSQTDTLMIVITIFITIFPILDKIRNDRRIGISMRDLNSILITKYDSSLEILAILAMIIAKQVGFELTAFALFLVITVNFFISSIKSFVISTKLKNKLTRFIKQPYYDNKNNVLRYHEGISVQMPLIEMFRYIDKREFYDGINVLTEFLRPFFYECMLPDYYIEGDETIDYERYINNLDSTKQNNKINMLLIIRKLFHAFLLNRNLIALENPSYFDYCDMEIMLHDLLKTISVSSGMRYNIGSHYMHNDENGFFEESLIILFIELIKSQDNICVLQMFREYFIEHNSELCFKNSDNTKSNDLIYCMLFCHSLYVIKKDKKFFHNESTIKSMIDSLKELKKSVNLNVLINVYKNEWHKDYLNLLLLHDIAIVYNIDTFKDAQITYNYIKGYDEVLDLLISEQLDMDRVIRKLITN